MASGVRLKATQVMGRPITWAQLNLEAAEDLRGLMRRNRWAAELMLTLITRMEPGGAGVVVCSRETMRELLGCSMPTVERALRLIIEEGWAQRIRVGGAHALAINSRVAWVGPRGDLSQAVFSATVIASRAEQDAIALNPPPMRPIPVMRTGDEPLMVGRGQAPPSQPDLDGMPPVVATLSDDQDKLEQRGQLPRDTPHRAEFINSETGELLDAYECERRRLGLPEGAEIPNIFKRMTAEQIEQERARMFKLGSKSGPGSA